MISPHRATAVIMLGLATLLLSACQRSARAPFPDIELQMAEARWEDAVQSCTDRLKSLPLEPDLHVELLRLRGNAHRMLRQYDAAIADFSQLIQLSPEKPEGYYLRAAAHREAGEDALAEAFTLWGKERDPQHQLAYPFHPRNFAPSAPVPDLATTNEGGGPNRPEVKSRLSAVPPGPSDLGRNAADGTASGSQPEDRMVTGPRSRGRRAAGGDAVRAEIPATVLAGAGVTSRGEGRSVQAESEPDGDLRPGEALREGRSVVAEGSSGEASGAGDGGDARQQAFEKWLARQRRERQARVADGVAKSEEGSGNTAPTEESPALPPLSTALPDILATPGRTAGPVSAHPPLAPLPRTTGLSSQAPAVPLSTARPNVRGGQVTTGWHSRRPIMEPGSLADEFRTPPPGQFFGTRPYALGQAEAATASGPILSTSLPGTELPAAAAPKALDSPGSGTQLPPERAVRSEKLPRPAGLATPARRP